MIYRLPLNQANTVDTVQIHAGTFNFSGNVRFSAGITLMGAGQDKTILSRTASQSGFFIEVDGSNGMPVVITGLGLALVYKLSDFR